ncbi:MAG: undecaprenyl-diphosphate phosphatase [Bacteroidales bacterium]|nr:undecaprenyl-diphosphate phosphatase [Bacteroidales bacterium]
MHWIESIILGIVQGLTEFLPISSSGHLEIGKALMYSDVQMSLTFTVIVHGATVLSTIVVFRKDIYRLISDLLRFEWNDSTVYISKLIFSMVPVVIVGLLFEEEVEQFFTGNLVFVGSMLLITATLLIFSYYFRSKTKNISFLHAFIIGISQALAVLPGISRSGATISTGLMLGGQREKVTRFSFLMVLLPIIGANTKDLMDHNFSASGDITLLPLILGFVAAFVSGLFACKWMIKIVNRGKLIYFAFYCIAIGLAAILLG